MGIERIEICGCGQTTHLEMKEGVEMYADIHGKFNEPSKGLCFNCHKPFGTDVPMAEKVVGSGVTEPVVKDPVTEPVKDDDVEDDGLDDMSLADLKATAETEDVPIAGLRKKLDIAAEIRAVREERITEPGR